MRAIALLSAWKFRNSLRSIVTDPRKLTATIVAVVYFGIIGVVAILGGGSHVTSQGTNVPLGIYQAIIFLAFLLVAVTVIDTGLGDNLLALAPADVDYIFPSPISRRVILLYRLPVLTFSASFFALTILLLYRLASRVLTPSVDHPGHVATSGGLVILGAIMCVGVYMNLAMFIAIRFKRRRQIHRWLLAALFALGVGIVLTAWLRGLPGVMALADSPWLRWPFLPSDLISRIMTLRLERQPVGGPFFALLALYAVSLAPMFLTNSNFYEDSIASSERVWALRRAAKGGFASMMAARAATSRYKLRRDYTLPPFGEGATALFWAHLCAAWKRPYANFVSPLIAGAAIGIVAGVVQTHDRVAGIGVLAALVAYSSFGFLAAGRTASEAAVRRRELTATLPVPAWQSVAANLGVPMVSLLLLCFGVSAAYTALRGDQWPLVVCATMLFFSLRMASRMLINYMLVLAYPDFADKIQQFLGQLIYYLFSMPLAIAEVILCLPAVFLRSFWLAVGVLTVFEGVMTWVFLFLAGRVTERAIASGEPVRFWSMRRAR